LLAASGAALPTGRWRSRCRTSSPPPLARGGFSTESRQNAFGDFQLIELVAQLRAARRSAASPPQSRPTSPSVLSLLVFSNTANNTTAPVFSDKWRITHPQ
jgi:hypothetical protein